MLGKQRPKLKNVRDEAHDQNEAQSLNHDHAHEHNENLGDPSSASFLSLVFRIFTENRQLREAYDNLLNQTAQALLKTLELRDPYTYGHSVRVMEYAMMIGRGANLKGSDMRNLELSAMFHDIGKVGVADCVLLKPGRLTPEEETAMREHPLKSAEIIELVDAFKNAVPGVKFHHERYDGEGYPLGLSGTEIPLSSRIILVADTFDAMTSNRPYRKALPIDYAYEELRRFSGAQFDPHFVEVFLREHQKLIRHKKAA